MKEKKRWSTAAVTFCLLLLNSGAASAGSVSVSAAPPPAYLLSMSISGLDSAAPVNQTYPLGTTLTLSATPTAGYEFKAWSGACAGSQPSCTLTMNSAKSVDARFAPILNVAVSGSGTVGSSPAGINCGNACAASFTTGTSVTLTPAPATGYVFSGWSGSCTGAGSCVLTMNGPANVTANFVTGPSIALKWRAPAAMGDGSALAGLVGFKVYGSRTRQDLNPVLLATVADPNAAGTSISGLTSGIWYLSTTAYTANAESAPVYYPSVEIP